MNRKIYRNANSLRKGLAELFEDYDYAASCKQKRLGFVTKGGDVYEAETSKVLFENLNAAFGETINVVRSRKKQRSFILYFYDEAPTVKVDTSEVEVISDKEDEVVKSEEKVFDLGYAESLYDADDKTKSKDDLEEYGVQFGIDLKKNKSFANMLTDLKNHCEAGE